MNDAKLQAREGEWYDDFYQAVQRMGCWYYFMIPHLKASMTPETRLLELGCGQGHILRYLVDKGIMNEDKISAIDQSKTAVEFVRERMPRANIQVGDIYRLDYPERTFDVCLLMETIEHLESPGPALANIHRVMAPDGLLYVSFPNFLHLPWLAVRLLSDLLHKPNWIVRQPIDKIYTVFSVIRLVKRAGFEFVTGIGSNYFPPVLYPLEKEWMTRGFNALRQWWWSFHPILVFRKSGPTSASTS